MEALRQEERLTYALNRLYQAYGYKRFKVRKFEEYDLYMRNRNFLPGGQILTFTNTDGKLMALKPDVTLSIVKNVNASGGTRKVYYTEQVYRAGDADSGFREITQTGLELIGDVDMYLTSEVVLLAAKSLRLISEDYILNLSHIGVASGVLAGENVTDDARGEILRALGQKNAHGLASVAAREGLSDGALQTLTALMDIYGPADEALKSVSQLRLPASSESALEELRGVANVLRASGADARVYLDFSIVNDMDYYGGVFFRGFVSGLPAGVLAGGRYDNLLARMGKNCGAIGFAVYLDQLERLPGQAAPYDVDRLILYSEDVSPEKVMDAARKSVADGLTVRVQKTDAGDVTYREKLLLRGEAEIC